MAPIESTNPSAMAATVGTTNSRVITLWVIADTRFDLPLSGRCHFLLSRGIGKRGAWPRLHRLLPQPVIHEKNDRRIEECGGQVLGERLNENRTIRLPA